MIIFQSDKVKEMLINYGAYDIKHYLLINNSGFIFYLNGIKYDLRHYRNIYGADVNYYAVLHYDKNDKNADTLRKITNEANNILKSGYYNA